MIWYLRVTPPGKPSAIYELEEGKTYIAGRDHGEIRVPSDEAISTRHVRLHVKRDEILFEDMTSTNGTFHRGMKKDMGVVLPEDELQVGKTMFYFSHREPKH